MSFYETDSKSKSAVPLILRFRAASSGSSKPYALTQHTRETPTTSEGFGFPARKGLAYGCPRWLAPAASSLKGKRPRRLRRSLYAYAIINCLSLMIHSAKGNVKVFFQDFCPGPPAPACKNIAARHRESSSAPRPVRPKPQTPASPALKCSL